MMTNLFSVFDPSSSIFSLSWMILFLSLVVSIPKAWKVDMVSSILQKKVISTFKKEVKFSLGKTEKSTEIMIMMLFMLIIMMNVLALYPHIFSPTSHLPVNLFLSLTVWLALMMYGWTNKTNHMLAHLVPQGTPVPLMPFMVMIEMISNLIRPITLCVRLTANLIAGHLLMSLLGNFILTMSAASSMILFTIPILLTILESAVACIQAYVFMTLITLYTKELSYDKKI